jgi:hypothetical protein
MAGDAAQGLGEGAAVAFQEVTMKRKVIGIGWALLLAVVFFGAACRQDQTATLTPEASLRALVESSRRAQPPETRAASVIDLHAGEEETTNPDKHTYTVDPSVEYADLTIKLRPYIRLKGKILNVPSKGQ